MRLANIREAPLIRAHLLLNQEKSKKGYRAIQPEINKMSELFGVDFDKSLNKSLFDEIEFKEMKTLINSKSTKTQYFLTEFSSLLERPNFISFFSEILMNTENISSAQEIFDGLNKVVKMTYENQFKVLLAFILSKNDRFVSDAKGILATKCKEIEREGKTDQLSPSTIQTLLLLVDTIEETKGESLSFYNYVQSNSFQCNDELKQISDIEKLLDLTAEEPIEIEKIYFDLGPLMMNNMLMCEENDMLTYKLDEKRLASFILFILKYPNWVEDKENKVLNRIFLKSMNNDAYKSIDDSSSDKKNINWNIDNFYKMFKEKIDGMDAKMVFNYLDDPSFSIKDKKKFDYFITTLQKLKILTNPNQLFNFIFMKWTNELNQIEFLYFLMNSLQSEYFSFKNYQGEKVKKTIEINSPIIKSSNSYMVDPWYCIELIQVMLKLSKGNYYMKVKEMFDWGIQNVPEIVALGLVAITPEGDDFLYEELIQELLTLFINNHLNSFPIIEEIWTQNKDIVIKTICIMYNSSPDLMNLSKILDLSQKLKESLMPLVNYTDYKFAVNLAILAVRRDYLHIDQWLVERIEHIGDEFIEALLNYIKANLIAPCRTNTNTKDNILEKSQLTIESLAVIFEKLAISKQFPSLKIGKRINDEIKIVYQAIFEIFDELKITTMNGEEIEHTANQLFKSLFKEELTVNDVVEKLKAYKDSTSKTESEIYACVIHCLLDEYRFYIQYPEKQLVIVSTLFGQIINHRLIEGVIETIALKYILEGIKKGTGPLYVFGITALTQCMERLSSNPAYLKTLCEEKTLMNNPHLYEKVMEKYKETSLYNKKEPTTPVATQQSPIISSPLLQQQSQNMMPPASQQSLLTQQQQMMMPSQSLLGTQQQSPQSIMTSQLIQQQQEQQRQQQQQQQQQSLLKQQQQQSMLSQQNMLPPPQQSIMQQHQPIPQTNQQQQQQQVPLQMPPGPGPQYYVQMHTNDLYSNAEDEGGNSSPSRLSKSMRQQQQQQHQMNNPMVGMLNDMYNRQENDRTQSPNSDELDAFKFIINSMGRSNVTEKAMEIKQMLTNEVNIKWFSSFFIHSRISIESNHHLLYSDLIALIDNKELNNYLIKDTISIIHKLLKLENLDNPKDKNSLKNLGNWLGMMTLAKNKPILAKDLDFKEIIFDAYEKGKLTAIVNFISKILEHSAKTKVFHPKNPWMQAILSLLAELQTKANLKQNLKFEIENLFKKLDIDLSTYPQSKLFDRYTIPANTQDFNKQSLPLNENIESEMNLNELFVKIMQLDPYLIEVLSIINKPNQLNKNELAKLLTHILNIAINEIITPVVERAVNISLVTTKELVIKDFMLDPDEKKFKLSASNCIKSLAGSLALVTCKEPLRMGYNSKLKEALNNRGIDINIIEAVITISNTDVLEIGCSYIHNYVIKKAIEKIQNDEMIISEIDRRKKGKPFDTSKSDLMKQAKNLPEVLRPNPGGLTPEQYKIYENFDKIYESYNKIEQAPPSSFPIIIKMLREVLFANTIIPKNFEVSMLNILNLPFDQTNFNSPEEKEQMFLLEQCVSSCKIEDGKMLKELVDIAFKYTSISLKKKNTALMNVYPIIMKGFVKLNPQIVYEITGKLFNDDISLRFNHDLHLALFKNYLIAFKEYEDKLYSYLEDPFTRALCRNLLICLKDNKLYSPATFKKILPFMLDANHVDTYFTLFDKKSRFPSDLTVRLDSIIDYKICNIKDAETYKLFSEMCGFAFSQIIDTKTLNFIQSIPVEKLQHKLKSFLDSPFISNDEQMTVFVMIITELCMKMKLCQRLELKSLGQDIFYPENEAKCIYLLLTIVNKQTNKLKMFGNILFGIFKTLHHDYVKSILDFNQRPYFKLFYNFIYLLNDFKSNEEILNSSHKKINYLFVLTELLRLLSPMSYPGFALAWLELISCKPFVSSFLEYDSSSRLKDNIPNFEKYLYLIVDLFSYLKNNASELISNYNSKVFLDNVYKYIFFLCNTYPEFISSYYFILTLSLPSGNGFMQLKNLILSCGPRDNDKTDSGQEESKDVSQSQDKRKSAPILFDISTILQEFGFRGLIDAYIESKSDGPIDELQKRLNSNSKEREMNFHVIFTIVTYWSQKIIKQNSERKIKNNDIFDFFLKLIILLDADNRDHLINSLLNEVRFTSSQTYFFSCLITSLLCEVKNDAIEEQIMRNIIERLLYNPRPTGLMTMFLQLVQHPKYIITKKAYFTRLNNDDFISKLIAFIKTKTLTSFMP